MFLPVLSGGDSKLIYYICLVTRFDKSSIWVDVAYLDLFFDLDKCNEYHRMYKHFPTIDYHQEVTAYIEQFPRA
ncbi:hypothetical protein CR513_62099, partial [Mucuna pruriens]